ncbi:hypothetical protein EE612_033539 [Oryza sativa]|nr:hypothetical protein EE612_033539 [Oryza sativa]
MASVEPEPMLTTAPLPRATIPGSTAAVTSVTAHRFTRIILTHASASASCRYTAHGRATPALFTTTPTSSPATASRSRRTASSPSAVDARARSNTTLLVSTPPPPSLEMASETSRSLAGSRPTRTRLRPRRASSSATERPMPDVGPVTTAQAP